MTARGARALRFVQSSDFHLHPERPERIEALRQVVRLAGEQGAGALLIPGDLFDAPGCAGALRGEVRSIFEDFGGATIVIPGNHDAGAFPPGADWGRRTVVLADAPYEVHELDGGDGRDVRVVGAPFQDKTTLAQVLAGFEAGDPLATVLLTHGTFEGPWTVSSDDEGGETAYLPVRAADLDGRFAYAALGHLHSRPTFDGWRPEAAWGYAGSPVAVTRGENGPRHAVIVDFEPGTGVREVQPHRLDTHFWQRLTIPAAPWEDPQTVIGRLREELGEASRPPDRRRGLRVVVEGWVEGDEAGFRTAVEEEAERVRDAHREIEPAVCVRTISAIIAERPEMEDLVKRIRKIGRRRGADDVTIRTAAGLLLEAAGGGAA